MKALLSVLALLALALAACGGGDETTTSSSTTGVATSPAGGGCSEIEEVEIEPPSHRDRDFTFADYETNPPAGGDHIDEQLEPGQFYEDPATVRIGAAVHLLEHGAVIGWTNALSEEDQQAVEEAFNEAYGEGYYQLAVVEAPDLDVPFALSAWGAIQKCAALETAAIGPFIEEWYASAKSAESALACQGTARGLPPC